MTQTIDMKYLFLLFSLSIIFPLTFADDSVATDGLNPFILIARIHIKEGMVDNYLSIADEVDKAVEASEPGMLFHNFDADPTDPLAYTWTEISENSEAYVTHNAIPPVDA